MRRIIGLVVSVVTAVGGYVLATADADTTTTDLGLDVEGVDETERAPEDIAARARIEFVGKMEIFCADWDENTPYAGKAWTYEDGPERAAIELEAQASRLRLPAGHMRDLPAPPGEEAAVAELLGGWNHVIALFDARLAAGSGFAGEDARLAFVFETEASIATQDARLAAFGFTECLDREPGGS